MTINTQKLRAFRQSLQRCASNTGHGHVYMRPDGFLAKCGGPGICTECAKDLALLMAHDGYEPPTTDDLIDTIDVQAAEIERLREALWVVAEHNALHFGESHNTVIVARAALAQEGS